MKVLGVNSKGGYRGSNYLVELSSSEMSVLTKGSIYGDFEVDFAKITEFDIIQKWNHAMRIIENVQAAIKLPSQLEAIAECMKIVVPKLEAIIEQPEELKGTETT